MRRVVIGDIHGCAKALRTVLEAVNPSVEDEIVFIGDYVDRGPNSRDVIDQILELRSRCRVVTLRGNHEIMMLGVMCGGCDSAGWLASGGHATLASYGGTFDRVPNKHREFFQELRPFYETNEHIFVHAGYSPDKPIAKTEDAVAYWNHLSFMLPRPHQSGKTVFVGHTPQAHGDILDAGHLVCVDTYCFGGGYLTALDVDSRMVWQADRHGHLRRYRQVVLLDWIRRCKERFRERFQGNRSSSVSRPVPQDS